MEVGGGWANMPLDLHRSPLPQALIFARRSASFQLFRSSRQVKMAQKRKLTDLECEALISEIECRSCLWNDRHSDFKNSRVTKKLWEEVGKTMNLSGDECKKKWKNLKDTFRKKVHTPQSKSGSASSPPHKKWKFTTLMEFIRDVVVANPMVGKLTSLSVSEQDATGTDAEFTEQKHIELSKQQGTMPSCPEDQDSFLSPHGSKTSNRKKEYMEKQMMELEGKKINVIMNMEKETQDDHHFFLSLLPYVTRLDDVEKLQLRSKIYNCVLEAVREHETRKAL